MCTVIAILLHFFYLCTFSWLFLEGLHVYRMISEVRDINYGPMRFYYLIGWGVPAFITGLTPHDVTSQHRNAPAAQVEKPGKFLLKSLKAAGCNLILNTVRETKNVIKIQRKLSHFFFPVYYLFIFIYSAVCKMYLTNTAAKI